MKGIFWKLRRALALMLAFMMLTSSVASAAPTMNLPAMMTVIESEAFKGDTSIENVVIPSGATTIGEEAFANCTSLQTVTIPDSVTAIGANAFAGCGEVTIICSSTSYAAQYAGENGLLTQFTDAQAVEMSWDQSIFTAYPFDEGGMSGCVVLHAQANGYDEAMHGPISWNLERIDDNQDAQLDLYLIEYGATAFVRMPESYGRSGSVTYRLTATADAFTESHEFTVELAAMPDTIPAGVGMHQTHFEVGDTLDFGKDDLYFIGGDFGMDEACVALSIPGIDESPVWTQNEAEFTDEGFRVTFTKDGRYTIPVWLLVNNALCYDDTIVITVGSGVCEEAYVSVDLNDSNQIFCGAENLLSVGVARLDDFALLDGETIEWSIESVSGEGLIELSCVPTDWSEYFAELRVENIYDVPGTETFCVTAAVGEAAYSQTFEIILLERPEVLPTNEDVLLETNVYTVNVGDTFEFSYDRIGLDETNLPEGMEWQAAVWNTESTENLPVAWLDDGFSVTFDQEGVYTFYAAVILTADYSIGREFTIVVGDGLSDEFGVNWVDNAFVLYEGTDRGGVWLTAAQTHDFEPAEGFEIKWYARRVSEGEMLADVYVDEILDGGAIAYFHACRTSEQTGEEVWMLVGEINGNIVAEREVRIQVGDQPENLPTTIGVENDNHQIQVGDVFEFTRDMFWISNGEIPEGLTPYADFWIGDRMAESEGFEWIDDGFRFVPSEEGRYDFEVAFLLGDYEFSRRIVVTVGSNMNPNLNIEENYVTDTLYIGGHDSWIISVGISGYIPPAGTDLCWELYPAEGQGENLPVEAFNNGDYSDGQGYYEIMINANPMSDEPGEATWILKAAAGDEVVYEKELVLILAAVPDDMNLDMNVGQTVFNAAVGEVFHYDFSNIQRGENFSAPEDAQVLRITYLNENFWNNESFQWVDGGLEIVFDEPGRYMFESGVQVSNYTNVEQIVVIVGEGPRLYMDWGTDVLLNTMEGSTWIGEMFLDKFYLHEGEMVEWVVRKLSGDADVRMYVSDAWDMGRRAEVRAELNSDATGETGYEIVARGMDGREYKVRFYLVVLDGSVGLPGPDAITVPQDVYKLNVGDTFTFTVDDFEFDDSGIPEGYYPEGYHYSKQVWGDDTIDYLEGMKWIDGGFTVTFTEPGRYVFRPAVTYAADCSIWKDVCIIVGDGGIDNAALQCNYYMNTVYAEGEERMQSSYELTGYNILPGDEVEWKLERRESESQPEEPIVDLYISWYSDDNSIVDINAAAAEGVCGSEEYILTCVVNGVEIAETIISVMVAELPGNMPTELWVEWDQIHVNPGDEVCFFYNQFGTADGEIPEGVSVDKEFRFGPEFENAGDFEWIENGFRFAAHSDGVYTFSPTVLIGNYAIEKQVTIVVGEGIPAELEVSWSDNAFLFTKEDPNDMWVTEAHVQDFWPEEGYEIGWYAERVSDTNLLEVYLENDGDRGTYASFHAYRTSEETGEETWQIVGEIQGRRVVEREITIRVVDSSEGLPTDLWVDSEVYDIEVGQEFVFTRDMFGPADGEIPEDIYPNYDLWLSDRLTEHETFEWIENGFRFVPDADGRYEFHVALLMGNYEISKRIVINVGASFVQPEVEWDDNSFTIYKGGEWTWITDAFIQDYVAPAGCGIEWRVERVTEGEEQLVNLRIANTWDNDLSAGFHGDPMSDQNGVEEWRIVAQAGDEIIVDRTISIKLTDLPEGLPTDIVVNDDLYIAVGEEFVFDTTMFDVGEGVIPEDQRVNKGIDLPDYIYGIYGFDWRENGGFYVQPDHDNRFSFKVWIEIGNYRIYRTVTVTVGTGEHPDKRVDFNYGSNVIYSNYEHGDETWVMDAFIGYYTPPAGCEIEWRFEYVGEEGTQKLEPSFGDIWNNNCYASISVRLKEHEPGEETWRVIAQAGDEILVNEEFTVTIMDLPENLPTEVEIERGDYFEINPGDEFVMYNYEFHIADGEVPEGAYAENQTWVNEHLENAEGFEWIDYGFRFQPVKDGTYTFEAAVRISNYAVTRTVTIKVGSGVNPDFGVDWDEGSFVMYTGQSHDMWVMNAHIHDYDLPAGMGIEWYVEQGECDGDWETQVEITDVWDDGYSATISARFADTENQPHGVDQWRVFAKVGDEIIVEREFYVEVADLPEDIFTEPWYEKDYFELQLGEEFGMHYDAIGWNGGNISEGMRVDKHFWIPEWIQEQEGFEWTDYGFSFTPAEEGRYVFEIAVSVGNYVVSKSITLMVGENPNPNLAIDDSRVNTFELYMGGHDVWVMDIYISNYIAPAGANLEWTLTRTDDQETLYAEPFIRNDDRDGNGNYYVRINANQMSDECGSNTWLLKAQAGDEVVYERELVLTLSEYPEELNIDVAYGQMRFEVAAGEEFTYLYSNVSRGEHFNNPGNAPVCSVAYFNEHFWNNETMRSVDGGIAITFYDEGRYMFRHGLQVNNYTNAQPIVIIVGEDAVLEASDDVVEVLSTMQDGCWVANAYLHRFNLHDGEQLQWEVAPVEGSEVVVGELYVDNWWENGLGANLHLRNLTGELGETTYQITVWGEDGWQYTDEMTVRVLNGNIELPGSEIITLEQSVYEVELGKEFFISADCFTFDEEAIPEGFTAGKELWGDDRIDWVDGAYWDESGFHVTFHEPGRYEMFAVVRLTKDYCITVPIAIIAGEISTENAALECRHYVNAIYPSDQDTHLASYALVGYNLLSTDNVEWEIVRYTDEYSPETPIVDAYVGWISENRDYVDIFAGPTHGEYDTELYDLICRVNGEEIARTGIEAHVLEAPENMPTELWTNADNDRHYVNHWDVFEFHTWDFDINGEYPEGVYTKKEVWVDEKLQSANGFEWLEDGGFRVQPDHDATYTFTAAVKIGNYCITRDVTLIVGAGDNSQYSVEWDDNANELYLHHGDIWVAGVNIRDYTLPDGMNVEWEVFRVDEDPNVVVEMYIADQWDGGLSANIQARHTSDDCGMNIWRVIARVGDEVLLERDFDLYVNELPDNLPADEDIWVELDTYYLNVGDTLEFTEDQFGLNEGDYDMGGFRKEIHTNSELEEEGFEWIGYNAFRRTFTEDGRYTFEAVMIRNNYYIRRQINIVVGTGIPADAGLTLYQTAQTMYLAEGMMETGSGVDVRLEGYTVFEGEEFDWNVARISEGEPCVEARVGRVSSDQTSVGLEFFNINAVGEETFEVTATTRDGGVFSTTFTMNVTDVVEGLPTDFDIGIGDHYEVGDFYLFTYDDVSLIGSDMTFDNVTLIDHGIQRVFGDENGVWWNDDGLNVNFHTEGVYELDTRIEIGNYGMEKTYLVTVGDGLRDDCHIWLDHQINTVYLGGDDHMMIGVAQLDNYTLLSDERIEWTLTKINGSENNPMELEFGDMWEYRTHIHVCNMTGEEGWVEYELTGTADRYSETHTIWVQVVNAPENLPTEIELENDVFELQVGEQLHLNTDFWAANGEIPGDAYVSCWYETSERFNENTEIEWHDGGFTATMMNDGRYVVTAFMSINNHVITRDIIVIVGGGVNEDMQLTVDQKFHTGFNKDDWWNYRIASVTLENYQLANGERIKWSLELMEGDTIDGEPVVRMYSGGTENDSLTFHVDMGSVIGTGTVTYLVKATTGYGQEFTAPITYTIIDEPDNLPGMSNDLTVYLEVGETFRLDRDWIQFDGEMPEGIEWHLAFDEMESLEFLPGFVWLEDEGFEVTFNRSGSFNFYLNCVVGTNGYNWQNMQIVVGEGRTYNETMSVGDIQDTLLPEPGEAIAFLAYLNNYQPIPGEKVEWTVEKADYDYGIVDLYVGEVTNDGCMAYLYAFTENGMTGEQNFRVSVRTENGYYAYDYVTVYVTSPEDMGFTVQGVSFEDITIPVSEEYYEFLVCEYAQYDGEFDFDHIYDNYRIYVDDALSANETFEMYYKDSKGMSDGFGFVPSEEGRYKIHVEAWLSNVCFEDDFILTVGDGWPDDTDLIFDQYTETIYLHDEQNYMLGYACVPGYHFVEGESACWELERIDGGEDTPVDIELHGYEQDCTLVYNNIQSEGSMTYRLTVATDGGFTDSVEFTLNVEQLPENLPTELYSNLQEHYEIGDTMEFVNWQSVGFADGEVPENASLRLVTDVDGQPIWHENRSEWTDEGFNITFERNGRYQFTVHCMVGNYTVSRTIDVTVGSGVSDDVHIGMELASDNIYTNTGDSRVGNFYLHNYTLLSGENVEWSISCYDGANEANLYLADTFDGGLGVNLHSAGTSEAYGWSSYRLTAVTSHGYIWQFEFGMGVWEEHEGIPNGLVGLDVITLQAGEGFFFDAEQLYYLNNWIDEGMGVRWHLNVDNRLQENGYFEWHDGPRFYVEPEVNGRYWINLDVQVGNRWVGKTIIVCVVGGEEEYQPHVDWLQEIDTVYPGGEGGICIGWGMLTDYPINNDDQVEFILERVDENGGNPAELYLEQQGTQGMIWLGQVNETGSVTYRLTISTQDGFSASRDYTVNVAESPENLPTALNVETEHHFEIGDTYTLNLNDVEFTDGVIPEGASVLVSVPGLTDMAVWYENESWFNEDGTEFSITFTRNARYEFVVCKQVGNHCVYANVHVYVGSGISDDVNVRLDQHIYTVYENGMNDFYIGGGVIDNYEFFAGEQIWTLTRIDDQCSSAAELCLADNGTHAELYIANLENCGTGRIVYELSLSTEAGYEWSCNLELNVESLPEDLPTAIDLDGQNYEFTVGDCWELYYGDACFINGKTPEGAFVRSWLTGIEESGIMNDQSLWYDTHMMTVEFCNPGEYDLNVTRTINNYGVTGTIHISVREPETRIGIHQPVSVLFTGVPQSDVVIEDNWLGDANLENIELAEGETVEWSIEPVGLAEGEQPCADVYIAYDWNTGARLEYASINGCGESTWRVTATVGENSWSADCTYSVRELPENLPDALNIEREYQVVRNQMFHFDVGEFGAANGDIPGDIEPWLETWDSSEGFDSAVYFDHWGSGFDAAFSEDGRHSFTAVMHIGNYRLTHRVSITVGNGVSDDAYAEVFYAGDTIYGWEESTLWVADANIIGFDPIYEDEVSWVLEPVYDFNRPMIEMYIGDTWDNGASVNVFARLNNYYGEYNESAEYVLSAYVRGQWMGSFDLSVDRMEWPSDLPSSIYVSENDIWMDVGDTYIFDSSGDIRFADGTVPEGAFVRDEIHGLEEGIEYQDNFEYWESNMGVDGVGFSVTFNNPGFYHFYAVKIINNYQVSEEIRIIVGEPEPPEVTLHTEQYLTTLYTEADDVPVAWFDIELPVDFAIFDTDEVYWCVSRITDENSPEEPVVQLEEGQFDGHEMLSLNANSTGTATGTERYLVEYIYWDIPLAQQVIELTVVEKPDDLPTRIAVDNNGYQVYEYDNCDMLYIPRSGGEFTFLHEDVEFIGGRIPEDAAVRFEVWNEWGYGSIQWHDNGLDFTLTFPAGDYDAGFDINVYINNYCIYYNCSFQIGSGSPK